MSNINNSIATTDSSNSSTTSATGAISPDSVSYTHLTLPTNREV